MSARFIQRVIKAILCIGCVRVLLAQDADLSRWANDFLGPTITLSDGRQANAAAQYWSAVVGVAFTRDIDLNIPPTPLDLNLDGRVDTTFAGHWTLPGGLLANPKQVGFVPTPDDPAGTVGRYSVSTGFLGVREELDPQTRRGTGRFGFNCWVCHGGTDENGRIVLGQPNTNINLGLIMASSRALDPNYVLHDPPHGPAVPSGDGGAPLKPDELARREGLDASFHFDQNGDGQVTIAEWRAAMKLPPARETQAFLMLAGPGRLDQSVDHRMDGAIPLANLQHYMAGTMGGPREYLRYANRPKRSIFNPVSIPAAVSGLGVAHYSWTGKDSSLREDAVALLADKLRVTPDALADLIHFPHHGPVDYEALSRALTLDLRDVATAGKEDDDNRGSGWPDKLLTRPDKATLTEVPPLFGAVELRTLLTRPLETIVSTRGAVAQGVSAQTASLADDPPVALGRRIFLERVTGAILNQRVLIGREARVPNELRGIAVLAPLDRSKPLDAKIPLRCASCHNYSPLSARKPIQLPLEDFQRCDLCHFDHPDPQKAGVFYALDEHLRAKNLKTVEDCLQCHKEHPDFGPQAYGNSWLLPFDANGNGVTQGDEAADAAAGGIGTDAYLNVDTLFEVQLRPPARRPDKMYLLSNNARAMTGTTPGERKFSRQGSGWVRVAPLLLLARTAPYLHNGSVPTLEALLVAPARRPRQFPTGLPEERFIYDTALPGNGNGGHCFGADLNAEEAAALARFLRTLP